MPYDSSSFLLLELWQLHESPCFLILFRPTLRGLAGRDKETFRQKCVGLFGCYATSGSVGQGDTILQVSAHNDNERVDCPGVLTRERYAIRL